jgi:uncharacterized protein
LRTLAQEASAIVSFNGKSFDLPLIETRFLFHRMQTPFEGVPHIDMLHPARRLWRPNDDGLAGLPASCRLSVLERAICGVAREGDVAGFEIPGRYFAYVRSGDARPLEPVLEHNRLDLVSLALLIARASQLLDEGPAAARTAREALGLGRLYERGELFELACSAYRRTLDLSPDAVTRAEALRALAVLSRRMRRFGDAAIAWQQLLLVRPCPPHLIREATEALAVHHEHRIRDLRAARQFALQCLRLDATTMSRTRALGAEARSAKAAHRLARLERKLAGPATQSLRF